jgi:hypothetical protein
MLKNYAFVGSFFMLILLAGGGCNFMGKQPGNEDLKKPLPIRRELPSKPTPVTSKEQIITSGYRLDAEAIKDEKGKWIGGRNYFLVSPQDNKTIFNASVQNELNKNNQTISSFDVPIDPKNTDRFFFSTYQDDEQAQRLINRIYSLDLKSNELKEIYKEENSPEEFKSGLIFRTVGRDGSKIIVMYDGVDNSPGPCANYWISDSWVPGKPRFAYLDSRDIKKGLQKYTVPKSKITSSEQEAKQCEKDLNDGTYWQ